MNRRDLIFTATAVGLAGFGFAYDRWVASLEDDGRDRGYTSILVVGGTLVTLAGQAMLQGPRAAVETAMLFVASGTPMIFGSINRHVNARKSEEQLFMDALRQQLGHDHHERRPEVGGIFVGVRS